jgi:ketosteroid isomerase-like protein
MADGDLEVVQRFVEAFSRGDEDSARSELAPDIVYENPNLPDISSGGYHGIEGVERAWREWLDAWADYSVAVEGYEQTGEEIIVTIRGRGRGRTSDLALGWRYRQTYVVRDGKIARIRTIPLDEG